MSDEYLRDAAEELVAELLRQRREATLALGLALKAIQDLGDDFRTAPERVMSEGTVRSLLAAVSAAGKVLDDAKKFTKQPLETKQ